MQQPVCVSSSSRPHLSSNQRLPGVLLQVRGAPISSNSTKGAAIFSGADRSVLEQMYGLSFQVVDDILDFTQPAKQSGKPTGSDLAKGNLTEEPKLRDIIEFEFCETGSLDEAIKLVKQCR
ncbi:hypothetical protein J1N35_043401 [Gossypium stocksii]|uniref:Uncharacterized protein n=1 Tax=Gossypium stocksii TaxID=47602 RepID=A0A9D3U7C3_9ROSI|nr:hypothetical protein J1N35_043401 [Gossypium stocksii]